MIVKSVLNNGCEKKNEHHVSKLEPWINSSYHPAQTYINHLCGFPRGSLGLGLGSHVAGVMVEAHSGCAAVLVQDLLAEAAARRVVLGDHIIRGRLATKLRAFGQGR